MSLNDVVISGLSGRFPDSDSIEEFSEKLFSSTDMVTDDDRRWNSGCFDLPLRNGKLKDITKFDASFFGVHPKQANKMDPQLRLLLEVTYEAIIDSGTHPDIIRGSKTGVFIGCSASECHDAWSNDAEKISGYEMTGCTRSMFANRLSYFFDFKGPSFAIDSACSSSLLALDQALHSIKNGICDSAIVGGTSLCLKPQTSLQFQKLSMLSKDGACKSFDISGNGYVRSEAVVAVFLQKRAVTNRVYATLIHSKNNTDGFKDEGITYPSGAIQKRLLEEVYSEADINPSLISYVELHGTGTAVGDPQETNSVAEVFCKNRKGALLIGSTKSNMGHPEPASGLAALAKVLIAMEKGQIPPNLHFKNPNKDIPALSDGRLQVVDKITKWDGGYVGINSFGFGGSNVHVLLHGGTCDNSLSFHPASSLVCCGGRTKEAVERVLNYVKANPSDINLQAMISKTFSRLPASTHKYRGWTLNNIHSDINIEECKSSKRPIWLIFAGMGTQWDGMGKDLLCLQAFNESIQKTSQVLKQYEIDLYEMINNPQKDAFNDTLHSFVGITAIQIALIDLLKSIGIEGDGFVGHSVGELGCAYADGALTAEETILAAYWRGRCVTEGNLAPGAMAAIGLTWEEAKIRCIDGVVPACHNSSDTVTITGMEAAVIEMVNKLQEEGIFAKMVKSAGVAFHSNHMQEVAPSLNVELNKVIRINRLRSSRWISSSIPESEWDSDLAKYSSASYHVNNLLSPVLFYEALQKVPSDAITIEVSSHCLLQAILKRSLNANCTFVGLMHREQKNNLEFLFKSLGKLYENGVIFDTSKFYDIIDFPVPRGTAMLSPLVEWDHSQTWDVPSVDDFLGVSTKDQSSNAVVFDIDISSESDFHYLAGHKIDGRVLFPATGYLVLAWQTFAKLMHKSQEELAVNFTDFEIHTATILPNHGNIRFEVTLSIVSGKFEISENKILVASGKITQLKNDLNMDNVYTQNDPNNFEISLFDIYKELHLRGYEYKNEFKGILSSTKKGDHGILKWQNNWITFLDTMLQFQILSSQGQDLRLPTRIQQISINPFLHMQHIYLLDGKEACNVSVDSLIDSCKSGGVEIIGLNASVAPRRQNTQAFPILESYKFISRYIQPSTNETHQLHSLVEEYNIKSKYYLDYLFLYYKELKKNINDDKSILNEKYQQYKLEYEFYLNNLSKNDHDSLYLAYNNLSQSNDLKLLLDIVVENLVGSTSLSIFEIDAEINKGYQFVSRLLSMEPGITVNYSMPNNHLELDDKFLKFNFYNEDPLLQITNNKSKILYDLVILSNSLFQKNNLSFWLEKIKSLLKPSGFILILKSTNYLSIATSLSFKSEAELKLICSQIEDHEQRTYGPFCDKKALTLLFESCNLTIVSSIYDGLMTEAYLLKIPHVNLSLTNINLSLNNYNTYSTDLCKLYGQNLLLRIELNDDKFDWVEPFKFAMEDKNVERIWIYSSNLKTGLIGMTHCLRREPYGSKIRCVLSQDIETDDQLLTLIKAIYHLDLVINVLIDGQWGTFRHMPLIDSQNIQVTTAYVNVLTRGDLSSLTWIQSPINYDVFDHSDNKTLYYVAFTSLNFRDIMIATGKLPPDAIPGDLSSQECLLGMEFSGFNLQGKRVMGLLQAKGLATHVVTSPDFTWNIPDKWSLEEAATVPVAYATAYYALVIRGAIKKGETVLIHSGSGAVGQASIAIALHCGCKVFTTIGSKQKQDYLLKRFPILSENSFANSRDSNFWRKILIANNGKKIDVVLNSLADDKLMSSVNLLAKHGRFLEIGKYDLSMNTKLGMSIFLRNIAFHGILLDALFDPLDASACADWKKVHQLLQQGIKDGVVVPLQSTIFECNQIEEGFRYMAQGKHIGKVLIKINSSKDKFLSTPVRALSRAYCQPNKSYLIIGGLGGFGLELAQWLVSRGCKFLVLTSRRGITTGYQKRCIERWNNLGIKVTVSKLDAILENETMQLLELCEKLAPLAAIFNLAMILADAYFINQTAANFSMVTKAKVYTTLNLDICSRKLALNLEWFVVFSSISCGRGNPGQSNYGFANSFMERICEERRKNGLHGLAIEWGAIGDVGIVADTISNVDINEISIGGTQPQRITSCLATLDTFLSPCIKHAIVSSYVLASNKLNPSEKNSLKNDLVESVAKILGIKDVSKINVSHSLGDLGLDSLMGVEIKQTLERDFEINIDVKQIRELTFEDLKKLSQADQESSKELNNKIKEQLYDLNDLIPIESHVTFNADKQSALIPLFVLPPIEGSCILLNELLSEISSTVYALNCDIDLNCKSIKDIAEHYKKRISSIHNNGPINLAGYSFGACVAIQLAIDNSLDIKNLFLLDGSHKFVSMFINVHKDKIFSMNLNDITLQQKSEIAVLESFIEMVLKKIIGLEIPEDLFKFLDKLTTFGEFKEKIDYLSKTICLGDTQKEVKIQWLANSFYQKLIAADTYKIIDCHININVNLIRASKSSSRIDDDYGVKELCRDNFSNFVIDGFHQNFFLGDNAKKVANIINEKLVL